ncbi:MAG TPA: tetratricopeptide repeat protein, partial [Ktedonobacteraceae bacterium]
EGTAWALFNLGILVGQQGEYARAISLIEESLVMHRELGDKQGIAWPLLELADMLFSSQGDPARVHTLLEEGLALCREMGHKEGIAWALSLLVEVFLQQGDSVKARLLLEEEMALSREIGHRHGTAESLSFLARVQVLEGDLAAARALYEESLAIGREMGDDLNIPFRLEGLADVVAIQGESAWAARLWGTAEALREARGTPLPPVYCADYERSVAAAHARLGEKAFAAAWVEGRGMTAEQAVAAQGQAILSQPSPTELLSTSPAKASTTNPDGLTPREVDVLVLLAQGLTSAQIAKQLVIGVVTVNFHVRSIYSKLGVTSRSAATRYALEHHLV